VCPFAFACAYAPFALTHLAADAPRSTCARRRHMSAVVSFGQRSAGAHGEGAVVSCAFGTLDCLGWPWALAPVPLAAMGTARGDAFADFILESGNGIVYVIVAPDSMDVTQWAGAGGGHVISCNMCTGLVYVGAAAVRAGPPGWGAHMAPGERVRLRYVAAARMVSVVWRGEEHELLPLPAACDVSHYHFGALLTGGNSVRLTGTSAGELALRRLIRSRCFF
jgi:hypothetical protein